MIFKFVESFLVYKMQSKHLVATFILLVIVISTFIAIIIVKSKKKPQLPFYVVDACKRNQAPISIGIGNQNENTRILFDLIEETLQLAIEDYNKKLNFNLFVYDNSTKINPDKIYIGVEYTKHGCVSHFDGRMGTLAHAFTPGKRICLDYAEEWEKSPQMLFITLLHEMGHSIGLRHINSHPSIMSSFYENIPKNGLTEEDVRDINIMLDRQDKSIVHRIDYRKT